MASFLGAKLQNGTPDFKPVAYGSGKHFVKNKHHSTDPMEGRAMPSPARDRTCREVIGNFKVGVKCPWRARCSVGKSILSLPNA